MQNNQNPDFPNHGNNQSGNQQFIDNSPNPYESLMTPPYDPTPVLDNSNSPQYYQHPNAQNQQYPQQNPYQQSTPSYSQPNSLYQSSTPYETPYQPPNSNYQPPNTNYQPPNTNYQPPNTNYQPPNTNYQPPNTNYQPPNTNYQPPNSNYQPPNYLPPNSNYQPPGSNYQQPNVNYQPPSSNYPPQNYPPNYQPPSSTYPPQPQPGQPQQLVDGPCTYNRTHKHSISQPFYNCVTCGLVNGLGCCEACARICHNGHQLVPRGIRDCYCDCGAGKTKTCVPCKCRKVTASQMQAYTQYAQSQQSCTFMQTGEKMVKQELFTCLTCRFRSDMCMCGVCARVCHYGHDVRSLGMIEGYCDCGAGNLGTQCKCMNGVQCKQQKMPQYSEVDACNLQ